MKVEAGAVETKGRGRRRRWARALRNRTAVVGYVFLAAVVVAAALHAVLAPHDPFATNGLATLKPPSPAHPFGTDQLGRDMLSRILYGAPLELLVSVGSVLIAGVGGVVLGLLGGYFGGWIDAAVVALADVLLTFPAILLAIAIVAILGTGLASMTWAIGIVYVPKFVRIVRGSVLQIKEVEYVEAARAMGASWVRILSRHVFPNTVSPLILQATLSLSTTTITAAALDFLGLGAQPPAPAWGAMINSGRTYLELAPWTVIAPSIAIVILCVGFNLAGDGLRQLLDPKQDLSVI